MNQNKSIKKYLLLFLLLLNGIIYYSVSAEDRNGLLRVVFLDVGQGDAIFIDAPSGNQILIDGGPDKGIMESLGKVMPFYDRTIDLIISTHPDLDHIGGLPEVMKNYEVGGYFSNGATSSSKIFSELEDEINKNEIKSRVIIKDETIDLGNGVFLKVLYPLDKPKGSDTNEYSLVMSLVYGNSRFLLTGDASANVEQYLANTIGSELNSDVLKVAHHGSKNSLSPEFFSAVSPEYSIISAGLNNRYGHPHKEVVDTLNNFGSKILKTFELGTIIFMSNGERLKLAQ